MKTISTLILLNLFFTGFSQNFYEKLKEIEQCQFELDNIELLIEGSNTLRRAILSPDAKKLLLLSKNESQIIDIKTKEVIRIFQYYFDGQWISDTVIMFRVSKDIELRSIYPDISTDNISIPKIEFSNRNRVIKVNYKGKSKIMADYSDRERYLFYGSLFSNDFNKVVVRSNTGRSFIYNIETTDIEAIIEYGIPNDWSDDDHKIISFLDLDYGKDYTVDSDLYIYTIETGKTCKLTNTEEILEFHPSWSKNKVTFINDKNNTVYIADIVERL